MAIYRGSGGSTSTTDQATIDQVAEDAATATTKATEAANSASAAASSASSASTSATNAASSASSASSSASSASTSATNASTSASSASSSATAAAASATAADASDTNAAAEAAAALSSKALALDAQTAAEAAESNASDHADDAVKTAYGAEDVLQTLSDSSTLYSARHYAAKAEESYTNTSSTIDAAIATATAAAASSATDSANSATASANSATASANSATSAASSASAAQAAEDAALAALDSFDDRYLGQKTSDPTVDNDGDALVAGALYYNSTDDVMKVYDGSIWVAAYASLSGTLVAANNLSDLASASAARTNLGLGTAATTASTDYVAVSGDSMTGDLTFGDNDKAIFGAGSDLQIYHNGSNSFISDAGTGDLFIRSNGGGVTFDTGGGETTAQFVNNGAVNLYYDGVKRLATTSTGIDVTGTVTADGLDLGATTDSATLSTTASDYQLQLGSADSTTGDIGQNISFDSLGNTTAAINTIDAGASSNTHLAFYTGNNASLTERLRISNIGDISFYEDTGTTAKFFWDASAESLGIGTSSPETTLHIQSSTASLCVSDNTYPNDRFLAIDVGITGSEDVQYITVDQADSLAFGEKTNNHDRTIVNEHMRIDSSGRVGIGTTTHYDGSTKLTVAGRINTSNGTVTGSMNYGGGTLLNVGTLTSHPLQLMTNNTTRMYLDTSGNVGIGTTSPQEKLHVNDTIVSTPITYGSNQDDAYLIASATNYDGSDTNWGTHGFQHRIKSNASGVPRITVDDRNGERFCITSSGKVGIGTSSPDGALDVTSADFDTLYLNRSVVGSATILFRDSNNSGALIQSAAGGGINFHTTLSGTNTERMRIDSSGNVGIGTSSPTTSLHVNGGAVTISNVGATLYMDGASYAQSGLYFRTAGSSTVKGSIRYSHSSNYIAFNTWNGSTAAERMRLESDGDLHVDGDVIAYSTTISDERLKENIVGIDGALDKVAQLNGYTFNYKADGKISAGVIAQEVEKVLPEAVSEKELPLKADDGQEYKVVNYDALHGLMIEAIKELKAEVADLKSQLESK